MIEDIVNKKLDELKTKVPKRIEIRVPPKKNPGIPYISLSSVVKGDDRIVVVEYDDAILVWVTK